MQNHYNYSYSEEESCYFFKTKLGESYKVSFSENHILSVLTDLDIPQAFSINIYRLGNSEKSKKDPRIGTTVSHIFNAFFDNKSNIVLFVCSQDNKQALCRYRKFNGWYSLSERRNEFVKRDFMARGESEEDTFYTSIVYHIENPSREKINIAIETVINLFNKDQAE